MAIPLPLVANVVQVTTSGTLAGKPCDHVLNWHFNITPGFEQELVNLIPAIDIAAWTGSMLPELPTDYILTGSRAVYLGDLTTTPHEVLTQAPGTSAKSFGPYFDAVTFRWPAPGRGKGKDGRTNFPGPSLDFLGADHHGITAAGLTAYQGAFDNYISQIQAQSMAPSWGTGVVCILSRKKGTFAFPQPGFIDPYVNTHRRWVKRLARH